jgi:uncharacterized membrane protein YebE (DUF533 family)
LTPERILGSLVRGALGGRRKRSRGVLRHLTGRGGSLITAGTLLGAAGLAWGAYEAATRRLEPPPGAGGPSPLPEPPPPPRAPGPALPAEVLRLVRLTISAARADGSLSPEERDRILAHAREVGAEAVVAEEIDRPRPLAEITAGVTDPQAKSEMYALAFAIVRADESVSGAERIYLAQLAHALGLDPATTARLEAEAAEGIDAKAAD